MAIYDYKGPRIMMKIIMKFSIEDRQEQQLKCNKRWDSPISKKVQAGFIAAFNDDKGVNAVIDNITALMHEYMHAEGQKQPCGGYKGWGSRSDGLKKKIKRTSV